jgi:hypothetical protein
MTRERRIILFIGALLLTAGAVYRFAPDMAGLFGDSGELTRKERRLARFQTMVQQKDRLQETLSALQQALVRTEGRLLAGNTPALAGVDLQNFLSDLAARDQVRIESMRVLRNRDAAQGYLAVSVQAVFVAEMRQLEQMLYRLETGPKLLRVVDSRFVVNNPRQWQDIRATLTVEGFMAKEEEE